MQQSCQPFTQLTNHSFQLTNRSRFQLYQRQNSSVSFFKKKTFDAAGMSLVWYNTNFFLEDFWPFDAAGAKSYRTTNEFGQISVRKTFIKLSNDANIWTYTSTRFAVGTGDSSAAPPVKLSNADPGKYSDGWQLGKTGRSELPKFIIWTYEWRWQMQTRWTHEIRNIGITVVRTITQFMDSSTWYSTASSRRTCFRFIYHDVEICKTIYSGSSPRTSLFSSRNGACVKRFKSERILNQ